MKSLDLSDSDYYRDAIGMIWADKIDITCVYEVVCIAKSGKEFNELIYSAVEAKDFLLGLGESG